MCKCKTKDKCLRTNGEFGGWFYERTGNQGGEEAKRPSSQYAALYAPALAAVCGVPAPGAAAAAVEEKTEFDVILKGFDAAAKLKVLKVIREVCGLGLKEAKDFVEAAATGPKTVKEGLSKEDAEKLAAQIKEVGGEVEVK